MTGLEGVEWVLIFPSMAVGTVIWFLLDG